MADPVLNATTAGAAFTLPEFLGVWETDTATSNVHVFKPVAAGTPPGPYQKVDLHNFKFLGREFQTAQYVGRNSSGDIVVGPLSGGGVCQELKTVLVDAQRKVFQAYARREHARGKTPSEAGFVSFCDIKGSHVGWQFRGGNHRFGAAIDIDSLFNPYIATCTGTVFGGEKPSSAPTLPDQKALEKLRKDAIEAYTNALRFQFGQKDADKLANAPFNFDKTTFFGTIAGGETSVQAYRRFAAASEALAWYSSTGLFPTTNANGRTNFIPAAGPVQVRNLAGLNTTLTRHLDFKLGKTNPGLKAVLGDDTRLAQLRDEIVRDHDRARHVMVFGSWEIKNGKQVHTATRDPCYGFLSLNEDIVVAIRDAGTRWGAVDFGAQESGDIMHFDVGKNGPPATTTDPNPNQITFNRQ